MVGFKKEVISHQFDGFDLNKNYNSLMFHCFDRQTVKVPKRAAGKVTAIVPLDNNHIAVLDENNAITLYKIPVGTVLSHVRLPFRARRLVATSTLSIIVLAAEDRSVYEITLQDGRWELIVRFDPSHHYNTQQVQMREREYFSTMALVSFNSREACFLRQERAEERKVRVHFLSKEQGKWANTSHELPLNGSMVEKVDEVSRLAVWKQQIGVVGELDFSVLDMETMAQEELHLEAGWFTIFTIVRAIRATSDGWLVCVNHKQPQILFFATKVNEAVTREQTIPTNLLWIASNDRFLLTLSLSEQEKSSGRVELRRSTGELMDRVQSTCEQVAVSREGELVVQYDRERKETGWVVVHAIRVLRKEKLYLHLMEGNSRLSHNSLSNSFMRQVLAFLN